MRLKLTPDEAAELKAIQESFRPDPGSMHYLPQPAPEYVQLSTGTVVQLPPMAGISMVPSCGPGEPRREPPPVAWWRKMLLRLAGYEWVLDEQW